MSTDSCDVLVVGSGAAGLTAALTAAEHGADVMMLTKGHAPDSSSWHAQGGIAGAIGDDDTAELHAIDTERAGRELCRQSAVRVLVEEGPERVRELIAMGVPFDPELNLEGGHSRRRVSSVDGAATGWAVSSLLSRRAAGGGPLRSLPAAPGAALVVALTGNLHASKKLIAEFGSYPLMAMLLPAARTVSLFVTDRGGEAWNQMEDGCRPHKQSPTGGERRGVVRSGTAAPIPGFDGVLSTGLAASALFPAIEDAPPPPACLKNPGLVAK